MVTSDELVHRKAHTQRQAALLTLGSLRAGVATIDQHEQVVAMWTNGRLSSTNIIGPSAQQCFSKIAGK